MNMQKHETYSLRFVDEQKYKPFLLEIATEVEKLLVDQANRKCFERHSQCFHKKWAAYEEAKQRSLQKIAEYRKKASKDERLCNKKAGPPENSYVWHDDSPCETGDPNLGFWRPPCEKPHPDPILRLIPTPDGTPPQNHKEELEKYYVLLIIIHDWLLKSCVRIDNDTCPAPLVKLGWVIDLNLADEEQYIIKIALEYVETDLSKKSAGAGQDNKGELKMIRPTPEDISKIIEKLKTLKEKLSDFINEKHKDVSVDKCAHAIAAFPIDESIDLENYIEKLSAEQLLKLLIGCDSSIPTEIKQKIPANEKPSKFLGMHPEQLFEKKLRQSSVVELQRWLNEVIPKLIADSKILSTKKRQLHQIENSVRRELERKEKCKGDTAKLIETINQADLLRRQRAGDWPKDIKQLMNEIEKLLFPYLDYLKEKDTSGKCEQASIEYLIKVGKPSKLDEVTQELEKIKHKMEVESQQSAPQKSAEAGEENKAGKSATKRKRPTKAEMENRNRTVTMATAEIFRDYGRLPSVAEIIEKTKFTAEQIYATAPYQEGKIEKKSAKLTAESTGGSVTGSEQFGEKSIEHSRANKLSKTEQFERDRLIDESKEDDARDEKQHNRYLRNKKKD